MRRWLPFAGPFLGIVLGVLAVRLIWSGSVPPCEAHTAVTVADVVLEDGCVELTAQAHYPVVVTQTVPGNLLADEQHYFVFPVFAEHDTDNRAIRVLVRTERAPEELVTYETMTVSGRLVPVTPDEIPHGTEVLIGKRSDYFFTDEMVLLVPDRIVSGDEVWVPQG
ncbi:MAG: hypothetical protein KTR31_09205 [Myxococcales bacterium]|nr:hypothetical protein [Myxococcales bacterium]